MMPNELKIFPYKTGCTRMKLVHAQGAHGRTPLFSGGGVMYY
jgi:hypothetical protein